ncbi:MAG: DUF3127 domain-containing protein [Bacteroidia bacterium]|nr:DUF3127 domain-containing protein [Bacteroidia bacterium]
MEITGKIIDVLDIKRGEGAKGPWQLQEYVLETKGDYPKKVCFGVWGDKIDQYNLKVNDEVTAHISLESREFNGKWYTSVRSWKIETPNVAQNDFEQAPQHTEAPPEISDSEAPF